jgi:hypothetical protein
LESIAGSQKTLGQYLLAHGARWVGIASTKEEQADFKSLMIGAGIAIQRGAEALGMGASEERVETKAIELERDSVAERVRRLLAEAPVVVTSDSGSVQDVSICGGSGQVLGSGAESGASDDRAAGGSAVGGGGIASGPAGGKEDGKP